MSFEQMQRAMQFVLDQQAQFAADLAASQARFDAGQARFDARMEGLLAKTDRVADGLIGLTTIVGHVVDSVSQIAVAQMRTDEQLKRTDEQLRRTDSRVDRLVDVFERHLSEGHGHRPS